MPSGGGIEVCADCLRADEPAGSLRLTSLARGGLFVSVCRGCFLHSELQRLYLEVECREVRSAVQDGLVPLYELLREQVQLERQERAAQAPPRARRARHGA